MEGWIIKDGDYYYLKCVVDDNGEGTPAFTPDIYKARIFVDKEDLESNLDFIKELCKGRQLKVYKVLVDEKDVVIEGEEEGYDWVWIGFDGLEINRTDNGFRLVKDNNIIEIDDDMVTAMFERLN